ncbi:MAG: SPFH domain-containing protein [Planctomycetota bacterium]|jgi:regulator of protease activity HflC (stomatin/prohibitin superfamily)
MMDNARSFESALNIPRLGLPMLVPTIACLPLAIAFFFMADAAFQRGDGWGEGFVFLGIASVLAFIFFVRGFVLVNPNQAKVILLFGRYKGTIRKNGFFWINPFTARRPVSLRAHNFNSETLKVNDNTGNPIEIGAVVVWRVHDTAQAIFDVEDYESYVAIQTESALRHLATCHPYDTRTEGETSLRGSAETVNQELHSELTDRLSMAGIEIREARLSHLAYAAEIAGAMLRRQQADAIIAARSRIVDGAVGMVQMALQHLKERGVIDLDEERKAAMVSNLLVVLCSEQGTTPVVNTGGLYQ